MWKITQRNGDEITLTNPRFPGVEIKRGRVMTRWLLNGKLHRLDGPATIYRSGTQIWCRDGYTHRDGGPAAIYSDGGTAWYQDGKLHRDDGPALEPANGKGEAQWFRHGERTTPNPYV